MAIVTTDITQRQSDVLMVETHPQYQDMIAVWEKMRDCQSERLVKERDDYDNTRKNVLSTGNLTYDRNDLKRYLPKTSGQNKDITNGETEYRAKKIRAEFPSNLVDTEIAMLGLLRKSELQIELPTALKSLIDNITDDGESIQSLNARIQEEQVITSRVGLLLDLPSTAIRGRLPYVSMFAAERIVNWNSYIDGEDEKFIWVVIDISDYEVNPQSGRWEWKTKYKVLNLDDNGLYYNYTTHDAGYDLTAVPDNAIYPQVNGRACTEIPFVICNASSTMSGVENPILEPLADSCLKYYRNDADYQELIFMQTIAIPCFVGLTKAESEREFSVRNAFVSTSKEANVFFAEVSGNGLAEARSALENTKNNMVNRGISLMESGANESGEALSIRLTTKTANLTTIAKTSAMAIEKLIKIIARWAGVNDKEVSVTSNNDFTDQTKTPEDMVKLAALVDQGKYSSIDYFNELKRAGMTSHENYEEWLQNTLNLGV